MSGRNLENSISKKEFVEITDLRMLLEPVAAAEASKRASAQQIENISTLANKWEKAVKQEDPDTYLKLGREFHFSIYQCAGKPIMMNFIDRLWNMRSPYQYLLARKSQTYDFSEGGLLYHRKIVAALRKRDAEALANWVRKDIKYSFNIFMAEFNE